MGGVWDFCSVCRPPYTRTAYIAQMIPNDEVYHFPQTNHITFAPGARSGWHSHGGMVILVTGGIGYYQEEGKPSQIIRKGDVVEYPEVLHILQSIRIQN